MARFKQHKIIQFNYLAFTSEDDATERATFAASASLFAPVTLTYKVKTGFG